MPSNKIYRLEYLLLIQRYRDLAKFFLDHEIYSGMGKIQKTTFFKKMFGQGTIYSHMKEVENIRCMYEDDGKLKNTNSVLNILLKQSESHTLRRTL